MTDGRCWVRRKFKETKTESGFYLLYERKDIGQMMQKSHFLFLNNPSVFLLVDIFLCWVFCVPALLSEINICIPRDMGIFH